MFGSNKHMDLCDFISLTWAIQKESTRRGLNLGSNLPNVKFENNVQVPIPDNFTWGLPPYAVTYNDYVDALFALDTQRKYPKLAYIGAGEILYWGKMKLLYERMKQLMGNVLQCSLPNPFDITLADTVHIKGFFTGSTPNRIATFNLVEGNANYCGYGWASPGADAGGTSKGIDSSSMTMVTNDEGYQAEQLTVAYSYRRGCGCGNDQTLHWTVTVRARSNGTYYGEYAVTADQWGC